MKALISYYFLDYIKSYRYVPPLTIYLVALFLNYTYKPNPVLSSTAVTALYLFLLMVWFTLSFFHTEDPTQQHLTILHAKSKVKMFLSKYMTMFLCVIVLSVFSVAYPVVFGMFGADISILKLIIGVLNHFFLGVLSVSMAALFTREIIKNPGTGWLGVSFVLLVSIASTGLRHALPNFLQWTVWVLPPVPHLMSLMEGSNVASIFPAIGFVYLWLGGYSAVLILLYFWLQNRGFWRFYDG
ncbi:ABC transporter permease [Lentibacillus kapialis]|uniref:ABC transporter permease n=1 Tax=Lentibacillus kapialis TaxID=340214 RepID=A0A917UYQ6_9BACI|nr:ABC transporter permease [Lentibacillus kapialis]GGJ99966.1 ABC transporter permease [Lentibacillus kapialis]